MWPDRNTRAVSCAVYANSNIHHYPFTSVLSSCTQIQQPVNNPKVPKLSGPTPHILNPLLPHLHHLQTLKVIARPILGVRVLGLARAILLPVPVRAINPHENLPLSLEHVHRRVLEPAIDEVAMEAVSVADLSFIHHVSCHRDATQVHKRCAML